MSSPADDTSVQVALRIRPQSASEKIDMCHICTSVTPGHPQVILGKDKAFTYDFVFDVDSIQPSIYEAVGKPLIEGTFDGYNTTILAYGQTGSGKTYTMGTSFDVSIPLDLIGIIPRAAQHLFDGITKRREKAEEDGKPLPEFKVSAQFLELYNEEIVDLLDIENKGRKNIKVHEDHNGNIYLTGIVSKAVSSAQDIMDLLEEGAISRTTAATNMNATSSRSHAIFTLLVKHYRLAPSGQDLEDGGGGGGDDEFETLNAKFNFVDLAGSERLKRTGATGDRAKEGISINQGLLSLGNVISALGDKTKRGCHVPYRDSKLTRLLQDSLGGNSRTLMIACVSPSDRDFMETLNTLKYANRARNIKNKVMVNQDKASKQIAMLRQEIQELTLELLEYKQGKRVADGSGEHMTDTFRELEMLRIENDNLRMRMKALQKNIDSQTIQLTELKVTSALSCISEENKSSVEEIVKKYEKDIQELSNKLRESEAMSSAAVRRAQTVSRMAMSPSSVSMSHDDDFNEIINVAKQELKKEKKKKKKLRKKIKSPTSEDGPIPMELDAEKTDTQKEDETTDEKNIKNNDDNNVIVISDEDDDNENNSQQNGIESEEELEHDEDEEDDDDEDDVLESNTDSDTDDELNQSLKDEKILQDNINELDTDITIKQRLIDELEHSQQRLTAMKHQYEQKLNLLHNKIKETEVERDKVLKSIGSVDSKAKEKSDEVRRRFEKKLQTMQKELSKLQNAKREHQRLLKTKEQNEQQLKMLRNEMSDMKKMKVKLMRQMRDEASRNKHKEDKLNRQMEAVLKENRKKEVEIKRMKDEKKQRDLVLKRKNEELNAMRRQAKPVSGNISTRSSRNANRPNNLQLQYQNNPSSSLNTTFVLETNENGHDNDVQRTPTKRMIPTALKGTRSPAVSKRAKQKWEILDRKITELQIRMKNVVQKENDMERWITDRERIGKQLETARKRVEDYEKHGVTQDDAVLKELVNQVEGLEAHMEYIQENIMESQGTIMSMEEEGEGINPHELITGCSATETKYILEHFYSKSVETAQELANKDAAYKQIQIKLEAMETHCEIQQQLLQHACILEFGAASEDQFDNEIPESEDILPDISNVTNVTRKARRKTALPEELLHPKDNKANKNNQPKVIEIIDIDSNDEQSLTNTNTNTKEKENKSPVGTSESKNKNVAETFKLDEKTLQKLYDLEKSLQDRKKMPPPATAPSSGRERSGSFSESAENQSASSVTSFQRNSRITRSARPFGKSASASNIKHNVKRSSSNKNSPLFERRTIGESTPSSLATTESLDSADVFKRLTSGLPQDADPDLGQILPSKSSMGKPSSLVCLYTATGHNNAVLSLDVTEDLMVTGSKDRTAKVWDLKSSEEILSLSQHKRDVTCVKFCPSKHLVFTVYQSTIKIWDIRTGNVVKTLSGGLFQSMGESSVMDLGLNSDGTVLYSAIGNTVKMIDLKTYSTLGKLSGHTGSVSCLLVVDTGHHHDNVITGSKDHFVKIFEVVDEVPGSQMPRQNLEPPHYDGVQSLAIKDKYLFSGSRDNTIKKWNYNNHNLEQHMVSAHKDWVMALDFVPDRNVLISGDRRGIMKLWDVQSCKQISEVAAHGKSINSIKCNSSMIFTASSDRLVRLWKPCETLDEQLDGLS